jgi:hypothetical protein
MKKFSDVKYWMSLSFATILVAISYELRRNNITIPGFPSYIVALFAFFIGAKSATFLANHLIGKKWFRKYIIKDAWIEGYWLIRTSNHGVEKSPLNQVGVLFLEYKVDKQELKAVTTRLGELGEKFLVNSEVAYVREDSVNVKYLNYFCINYPGPGKKYGMAFAEFSKNSEYPHGPNTLEGNITLEGEGEIRRQSADRISDECVSKLRGVHGEKWIMHILETDGKAVLECSTSNISK